MHDIRSIRDNPDAFDAALARRGLAPESKRLITLDEQRRTKILALETIQARRNAASKEIGEAKKNKDEARAKTLLDEVAALKDKMPVMEAEEKEASAALDKALSEIPNLPLPEVPDGKDEKDNVEHHRFGAKRDYAFAPKQHFELGEALGQMDFETAAKLSGARFVVLKKGLARLERALGQFMLDVHTSEPHNYTEVAPPLLVLDDAMFGTAQLPKFRDDQFSVSSTGQERNLWLIPTAEVPLTNLVRESIVDEAQLPMRLTACTPCFRAGNGRSGQGHTGHDPAAPVHQGRTGLDHDARTEQGRARADARLRRGSAQKLDLHYRVVTLCTGDMGFASQKTYDIEVWLPGQNMFREISSCSVCGDFQARRMNARYKNKEGRNVPVHTLNGSGVAVGRAMIAVMETYQQEDGSIAVPDVLQPYMGGMKKIEKSA